MGRVVLRFRAAALAAAFGLATACDAGTYVLWPWVEEVEPGDQPEGPRTPPPPPPLEPVDPLDPDAVDDDDQMADAGDVPETVPNPNANTGAPEDGTPFEDLPENEEIPVSDSVPTVPVEDEPADDEPAETPDVGEPEAPPVEPPAPAIEPSFDYYAAGDLEPRSGTGSDDETVFVPDMQFPIRSAASYPQSQVYRFGGGVKGGDQCDARNFAAPWRDNYCESRSRTTTTPFCEEVGVHLGQDIRVGDREGCLAERSTPARERARYEVVAVEDGVISNVGSYSINLRANGRIYRYMHLNMSQLKVEMGQQVKKGDLLGYVSNDFGGTPTTLHLHFEIKVNTAEYGWQYVPPYTSLLAAYQRREDNPGQLVEDTVNVATTP